MKVFLALASLFLAFAAASAENFDYDLDTSLDDAAEARLFFVNFTSSLVQVNATILAYGLLFLAILGAAAVALYYLYLESQNSGSGYGYSYGQQGYGQGYQYARYVSRGSRSLVSLSRALKSLSLSYVRVCPKVCYFFPPYAVFKYCVYNISHISHCFRHVCECHVWQ